MGKKWLKSVWSGLRWINWLVTYVVVYPLALLALLFIVGFVAGGTSPGTQLVRTIESVQQKGFVIEDCTPLAPETERSGTTSGAAFPPPLLAQNCAFITTDAAGYAAYIDAQLMKEGRVMWLLLAMIFTAGARACGFTPCNRNRCASEVIPDYGMFKESRPGRASASFIRSVCQKHRTGNFCYRPCEKNTGGESEDK